MLARGPVTTMLLAERMHVDSRTARRLLGGLVASGYAARAGREWTKPGTAWLYVAGPRLRELADVLGREAD